MVGSTSANEVQMNANLYSYPSINTLGFTGVFKVATNGVLELPHIIPDEAAFGLTLSGTGFYKDTENIAVTALVIAGTQFPAGVYAYSDFTPAQQAYLGNSIGVSTVFCTNNTPPVLVLKPALPVFNAVGWNNDRFSFTVSGTNGPDYVVQVSTNLLNWSTLWTNASPVLRFNFSDTTTNFNQRFYRILLAP